MKHINWLAFYFLAFGLLGAFKSKEDMVATIELDIKAELGEGAIWHSPEKSFAR